MPRPRHTDTDGIRRIFAILLVFTLTPAGNVARAAKADPLAGYVVLGQTDEGDQYALARVIVDHANPECPGLKPDSGPRIAMTARRNPDPVNFTVMVCEAVYPTDGSRLRVEGSERYLPGVPQNVNRVTVFGDTGCNPKDQKDCTGEKNWPFGEMADAAARAKQMPDLVLHMGDYNYRATPGSVEIRQPDGKLVKLPVYDAGDHVRNKKRPCKLSGPYVGQNGAGSQTPDSWTPWKQDFFEPAEKLLSAAPWVFARGNHELCSRAGPGYFYFLDPGSDLVAGSGGQLACPPAEAKKPLIFRQPYRLDFGGLSLLVLDSANACDLGDLHQHHFDRQFAHLQALAGPAPSANALWLVSHRPLWGIKKADQYTPPAQFTADGNYVVIDATLQSALAAHPLPKPLHLALSGHIHRFQSISFAEPNTPANQLVIGNGGVELASNHPKKPFNDLKFGDRTMIGFGLRKFGYMRIDLAGNGDWSGTLLSREGHTLATCDSREASQHTGACSPAED